jgi:hypothetical protein
MAKEKEDGKLMGGRIRERRVRKRGLDLQIARFFWENNEKPRR